VREAEKKAPDDFSSGANRQATADFDSSVNLLIRRPAAEQVLTNRSKEPILSR